MVLLNVSRLAAAGLALALSVGTAHAGLFDDDEARKAIVDLRNRVIDNEAQGKASQAELAAANAQLVEQLAALRRSVLDLNDRIEAMRGEIATLRGSDERLVRELSEVQRRQKDTTQSLDERLGKVEPTRVILDGREFLAGPAEKAVYDEAMAAIRGGDFERSLALFNSFQQRYPSSGYADSVRYWLGNALYGRGEHKEAIAAFRAFVTAAPAHPLAPEALLAMANSQAEMKDMRGARRTLDELIKSYPLSEAAVAGKQRLASIK